MTDPQAILDRAVAEGDLPFAVALVAAAGGTAWQGAAGDAAPGRPAGPDTVLRLFSMSKAVGAVAAAILVDRGRIGWDDPVGPAIPAFDALPVLDGRDGDAARLRPQRTRATLAQLLAHTSGAAYEIWHPGVARFNAGARLPSPRSGIRAALDLPLAFDPGAGWAYGTGPDWAGLLIEAVDGRRIDAFVRDEILDPLGMADTVFEVPDHLRARLAGVWLRTPEGLRRVDAPPVAHPEFWGMGHALTGPGRDYLRFLRMLLNHGTLDGQRILSKPAAAALLTPRTGRLGPMPTCNPGASATVVRLAASTHSLLGVRTAAIPGRRGAGAQGWAGSSNTHWWLDPIRGRAGLFLTQLRPFWDPRVMAALEAFERAVHDR